MVVDLSELRRQVAATQQQIREAEEVGDEEQILDLICEANELRDALRNYETFDALWEPSWNFDYDEVVSSPLLSSCWVLTGLLPCGACRKLLFAIGSRGFEEDSGDASRFGSRLQNFGRVLRSDDDPLAELLWKRASPAAVPLMRAPPGWRADSRITYEELRAESAETVAGDWRVDSQDSLNIPDYDDRDDFRPLFTLLLCLGASAAAEDEGGGIRFRDGVGSVPLAPGSGVLLPRSDNFRYQLLCEAPNTVAAVAHAKVLFGPG
eukprot:s589_g8.t1